MPIHELFLLLMAFSALNNDIPRSTELFFWGGLEGRGYLDIPFRWIEGKIVVIRLIILHFEHDLNPLGIEVGELRPQANFFCASGIRIRNSKAVLGFECDKY